MLAREISEVDAYFSTMIQVKNNVSKDASYDQMLDQQVGFQGHYAKLEGFLQKGVPLLRKEVEGVSVAIDDQNIRSAIIEYLWNYYDNFPHEVRGRKIDKEVDLRGEDQINPKYLQRPAAEP